MKKKKTFFITLLHPLYSHKRLKKKEKKRAKKIVYSWPMKIEKKVVPLFGRWKILLLYITSSCHLLLLSSVWTKKKKKKRLVV